MPYISYPTKNPGESCDSPGSARLGTSLTVGRGSRFLEALEDFVGLDLAVDLGVILFVAAAAAHVLLDLAEGVVLVDLLENRLALSGQTVQSPGVHAERVAELVELLVGLGHLQLDAKPLGLALVGRHLLLLSLHIGNEAVVGFLVMLQLFLVGLQVRFAVAQLSSVFLGLSIVFFAKGM